MIQIDYRITLSEYIDGSQAINRIALENPWMLWGIFRGLPVLTVLLAFVSLWLGVYLLGHPELTNDVLTLSGLEQLSVDATTFVVCGLIGLLLAICFAAYLRPGAITKNRRMIDESEQKWQKDLLMGESMMLTVTDSGLSLMSESLQINCEWNALTRVVESQMVFVFYWFTGESRMVSKQFFASKDSVDQFRGLIQQNVKQYIDLTQASV
jgi:hypothetical protein